MNDRTTENPNAAKSHYQFYFKSKMKLPNVPELLALEIVVITPLKALVSTFVEGMHILPTSPYESYNKFPVVPVYPATANDPFELI